MAKSPNIIPISSMFVQWSQPYVTMQGFGQFERSAQEEQSITVSNELARLDHLEEEVQSMLTYPDAEAILNKIMKENRND